jgi:hypothetical protein
MHLLVPLFLVVPHARFARTMLKDHPAQPPAPGHGLLFPGPKRWRGSQKSCPEKARGRVREDVVGAFEGLFQLTEFSALRTLLLPF